MNINSLNFLESKNRVVSVYQKYIQLNSEFEEKS